MLSTCEESSKSAFAHEDNGESQSTTVDARSNATRQSGSELPGGRPPLF